MRGHRHEGARLSTVVTVELPDAALAAEVVEGLAQVEDGLQQAAQAQHELLAEASRHLIGAGGKRFRATLVLLAAQFGDPATADRAVRRRDRAHPPGHPVPR